MSGRKHSPLPWTSSHGYIFDATGGMVADYDEGDHPEATVRARGVGRGLTDEQQDENMADICEAMNERAALTTRVEALEKENALLRLKLDCAGALAAVASAALDEPGDGGGK